MKLRCGIKELDSAITFVGNELYLKQAVELTPSVSKNYITNFYTKLKSDVSGDFYALSEFFCHKGIATPVILAAKTKELIEDCSPDTNIYLVTEAGDVLAVVGTINLETGELNYTVQACDGSSQIINILVVPEVIEIPVGSDVVPSLEVEGIEIYPDLDPSLVSVLLDPGSITLPTTTPNGTAGDPAVIVNPPPLITDGPGGGTVTIPTTPSIIDDGGGDPGSTDPVITDPNDILNIDDYIPETNPYSCS